MNSLNMRGFLPHRLACVLLGLGFVTPLMAAQAGSEVVGEVTLLIGQAQLVGADDVVRTVERGQPVRAGDRIETREGGHVHVRFVDGGRLSVRPASRLQIENYSHSATQPQGSAIKFRLDEGVIRSITGTWGEEARERFRLNTPMAAIGIKGTDFVVKSDANVTAASVYSGAILLAPASSWAIVAAAIVAIGVLAIDPTPLVLPPPYAADLDLHGPASLAAPSRAMWRSDRSNHSGWRTQRPRVHSRPSRQGAVRWQTPPAGTVGRQTSSTHWRPRTHTTLASSQYPPA